MRGALRKRKFRVGVLRRAWVVNDGFCSGKSGFALRGVSEYFDITPTRGGDRLEAIGLRLRVVAVVGLNTCAPRK